MNNYCRNCGNKLTNLNKCDKCGTKVLNKRITELDKVLETKYRNIFLIAFIGMIAGYYILYFTQSKAVDYISPILSPIISILPFALMIFVIYAKVKLKRSGFFNAIFWIMLIQIILLVLFIIFLILMCEYA